LAPASRALTCRTKGPVRRHQRLSPQSSFAPAHVRPSSSTHFTPFIITGAIPRRMRIQKIKPSYTVARPRLQPPVHRSPLISQAKAALRTGNISVPLDQLSRIVLRLVQSKRINSISKKKKQSHPCNGPRRNIRVLPVRYEHHLRIEM
jgi:hypothetical protein